ncbi:hypothetical protein BBD41_12195 [Paenibacillus ihbetae]|uniref:Uncharacterized protein n=1 Tax=Paenibacillus ihbetae TaxID=1870820 RepID=A0A1B2DZW9_9BACL|nr:hypothetical protein [Paenibacillus ihbetae]ANY73280.1 hypothetical protein BBD41_12195 [Paenibacillus ihbetae]
MNHKHVFGKLALSAALLVASAGTAHASADSSATDRPLHNVKIYQTTTEAGPVASSVRILPDPLELVKQYATETLKDWEQTLEKYKKLAVTEGKAFFIAAEAPPTEPDPEAQEKSAPIHGIAIAAVKAPDLQGENIKELKEAAKTVEITEILGDSEILGNYEIKGDAGLVHVAKPSDIADQDVPKQWVKTLIRKELKSDGTASDITSSPKEASIAIKAAAAVSPDDILIEAAPGRHEEVKAVKLTERDIAFIKAQMELAQAVESKDSDAIKNALAQLLEQYKAQIAQLELKAAKEDADAE